MLGFSATLLSCRKILARIPQKNVPSQQRSQLRTSNQNRTASSASSYPAPPVNLPRIQSTHFVVSFWCFSPYSGTYTKPEPRGHVYQALKNLKDIPWERHRCLVELLLPKRYPTLINSYPTIVFVTWPPAILLQSPAPLICAFITLMSNNGEETWKEEMPFHHLILPQRLTTLQTSLSKEILISPTVMFIFYHIGLNNNIIFHGSSCIQLGSSLPELSPSSTSPLRSVGALYASRVSMKKSSSRILPCLQRAVLRCSPSTEPLRWRICTFSHQNKPITSSTIKYTAHTKKETDNLKQVEALGSNGHCQSCSLYRQTTHLLLNFASTGTNPVSSKNIRNATFRTTSVIVFLYHLLVFR